LADQKVENLRANYRTTATLVAVKSRRHVPAEEPSALALLEDEKTIRGAEQAGASITLRGTGANAKAVYSSEALKNSRNIGRLRYYTILDWYE